ncbi:MAG TPA: hypothetical protein VKR32_08455 [Puia sp.]|nr:hypothetical protein [Puia sp.]
MTDVKDIKEILTRENLYDLVWSTPISKLSKEYPVADSRLRTICKDLNIPLPDIGYRQKILHGKEVFKPPLPKLISSDPKKELLLLREITEPKAPELSALGALNKEIAEDSAVSLVVPDKLARPDKLILAAKEALEQRRRNEYYRPHELLRSPAGYVDIRVTPANAARALRFMDTLIKALRARGHDIRVEEGTYAVILEQKIKIIFREKTKRGTVTDGGWTRTDFLPTGVLAFQIDHYDKREWADGTIPLESYLAGIIAKLELIGKYWYDVRLQNEKDELLRKERENAALKIRQRKEKEESDFKKVLQESARWHEVNQLRAYINHMEKQLMANNFVSEQDAAYFSWAREKADHHDPSIARKDT